ncbi:MAG: hypothetical protein JXR63_06355, partial [Spirochaetales bacterium]|nr:hypothetical protein [Spirochaetales bacterium]
ELSIRTLQQGDRFFIKGKYRDVFSYLKKSSIPQKIREISYVFEKNGEIILIVVPFKEGKYILSEQSLAFVKNNKYYMYIQILNDGDL